MNVLVYWFAVNYHQGRSKQVNECGDGMNFKRRKEEHCQSASQGKEEKVELNDCDDDTGKRRWLLDRTLSLLYVHWTQSFLS